MRGARQRRDQEQPRRACKALWKGPLNWTVNHGLSVAAIHFITATFWLYLALEAAGAAIAGIPPIRSDLDWLKASLGPQTVSAALRWLLAALAFFLTLAVAPAQGPRGDAEERDEGGRQARRRKHHERGKGLLEHGARPARVGSRLRVLPRRTPSCPEHS